MIIFHTLNDIKKTNISLLIIILIGLHSCAQDLTCADFQNGKFYIPASDKMKNYTIVSSDSTKKVVNNEQPNFKNYTIIRDKNTQIEWAEGLNVGIPAYEKIEWINDCTYRLTYDKAKTELDDRQKWINENNGIIVSKIKIEGRCMLYKATMTTIDGVETSQNGKICKE